MMKPSDKALNAAFDEFDKIESVADAVSAAYAADDVVPRAALDAAAAVDGDAQNTAFKFRIGEPVRKPSGYAFDGTVVSAFMVAGGDRYVVESEAASGLLHIFNGSQLERRS